MEGPQIFKIESSLKKEELKATYGKFYKVKYFKILKEALNKWLGRNMDKLKIIMEQLYKEGIISKLEYDMCESDCDITKDLYDKLNSGLVEQMLMRGNN